MAKAGFLHACKDTKLKHGVKDVMAIEKHEEFYTVALARCLRIKLKPEAQPCPPI